jgi:glycosyltransferase involved in cell wall biosynthesis
MYQVVREVPDALLVIVGCAPPDETEYETECRRLVRELGLDASVHFTGYRRDVPAWMHTFDTFALPTRAEPFGKVVIEAMAASKPVVASNVGGIPEIVHSPELGALIEPDDEHALARQLSRYLTDSALRERVGRLARESVYSRFSLEAMVGRLEHLYDTVLETRD